MATIDTSGADAVRVVSDERLDIPDFDAATFGLNSEQLTRVMGVFVGAVLGTTQPFMGCASRPSTSYDSGTKFLTINGCLFYQGGSASVPTTAPAGRLIAYDPTQAWQLGVTGVSLSTFSPSTACVVWALPTMDANSNLETRKRWLPGATGDASFSTQTRTRTIISAFKALAVGASPPSTAWFPVFKIASWTAGSPNVTEISMWDGTPNLSLVGNTATGMPAGNPVPNLAYILYTLRKGAAYILDNTGGDNWTEAATNPYRGLKQLNEDTPTAALAAGTIADEGSGWTVVAGAVGLTLDSVGGGGTSFTITHDLWVSGGTRVAVAISPITGGFNSSRNFTYSNDDNNTITVSWFNSATGGAAAVDTAGFSIVVYCVR